jgi:hypothetical protein
MNDIVILGGARDYHAMDWYRTLKRLMPERNVVFLTDLIGGEGFDVIIDTSDNVQKLYIIDKILFRNQSKIGNIWRNLVKLIVLPVQMYHLKRYAKNHPNSIYHAHPMYYMFLCWLSGIKFIGTPQGDEILIRPYNSFVYKYFAQKALQAADYVTVDSVNMQKGIQELSGVNALIYQYGVDVESLLHYKSQKRTKITSIRGMLPLYRIQEIVEARNAGPYASQGISFIYPYQDEHYYQQIKQILIPEDNDLGRLDKEAMFTLLSDSFLVLSIPMSDSSPRSVYESIFLGCCVAVTYNNWIEALPSCMRSRLFIVELEDPHWFSNAVDFANTLMQTPYIPSEEALEMFDQNRSIGKVINTLYSDALS